MKRDDLVGWLESRLGECDVPERRWTVGPGLEDFEVQGRSGNRVRLRIVLHRPPRATGLSRRSR